MPSQDINDPGGPWGSQSNTPPDLELLIKRGLDSLKRLYPGGSPGGTLAFLTLFIIGLNIWSSYYTVPSDSVAVVQRFGMHLKEVAPGLHFKLPLGIDKATTVPVKRQLKQEFGFATPGARDRYQGALDGKFIQRNEVFDGK